MPTATTTTDRPATANASDLLTTAEVARLYRVGVANVVQWIRSGTLPAIDISRGRHKRKRYRIRRADLPTFERRRATQPPVKATRGRRPESAPGIIEFW